MRWKVIVSFVSKRFNTGFLFKLFVRVGAVQEEQWIKSQNMLSLTQVGLL